MDNNKIQRYHMKISSISNVVLISCLASSATASSSWPKFNIDTSGIISSITGRSRAGSDASVGSTDSPGSSNRSSRSGSSVFNPNFENGMVGATSQDMKLSLAGISSYHFYEHLSELLSTGGLLKFSDQEQFDKFAKLLVEKLPALELHSHNLQSRIKKAEEEEIPALKRHLAQLKEPKMFGGLFTDRAKLAADIKTEEDELAKAENRNIETHKDLVKTEEQIRLLQRFVANCGGSLDGEVEGKCVRFEHWYNFLSPK